jgi:AcrR family transcriptional regulator
VHANKDLTMAPRKYELGKRAENREATRERIIQATFELHREKGVIATSMQDIAERADVALRTVYNHYPTVDDLVAGCGRKVMAFLAPPTPEILDGVEKLDDRLRVMVDALFAMYERGGDYIEVGRTEQGTVKALVPFLETEAEARGLLAREALRPFTARSRTIRQVAGLTDFYVWKALTQQQMTTHQAADVVHRSLVALVAPEHFGKKGTQR